MIEKIIHAMQVSIDADVRMVLNPGECQVWLAEIERLRAELDKAHDAIRYTLAQLAAKNAEIERLREVIKDVLDNFDMGDKTTINYMVERLREATEVKP